MEVLGLLIVAAILGMPIAALVVALGARRRADALDLELEGVKKAGERVDQQLLALKREIREFRESPGERAVDAPTDVAPPASATRPPATPPAPKPAFDWEGLVGVKLFSWLAGICLVTGALYFLGYSIQQGWLSPPIRMAIGLVTGVALLVVCELKAARRYATTANALDGAAIAILFSTFFAAHALWKLLPVAGTFLALALVAAVAVALSIRRDSLFIALLGLLGGFATPALLSTGEDQPLELFGYLLLLSAGLAWVAHRKRWPVLSALAIVLTTIYQWAWVWKFLTAGKLPVAIAIFLVFPLLGFATLAFGRRRENVDDAERRFTRAATFSGLVPFAFALYLAAVPAYGARFDLLFGFLFLLDAGLLAVALWRGPALLHVAGAASTLIVFAVWLGLSWTPAAWPAVLGAVMVFVLFFLGAPFLAERIAAHPSRPGHERVAGDDLLEEPWTLAAIAAPLLLFTIPTLVYLEPRTAEPGLVFGVLFVLDLAIGVAALVVRRGHVFAAAIGASGLVLLVLEGAAGRAAWSRVDIGEALLLVGLAFAALWAAGRRGRSGPGVAEGPFAAAPAVALLLGQCVAIVAAAHPPVGPSLEFLIGAHLLFLLAAVALSWQTGWHVLPLVAMAPAFIAVNAWTAPQPVATWSGRLLFTAFVYAVFLGAPLVLGRRGEKLREPFLGAVLASVAFFFIARDCLSGLGYGGAIGLLPVVQAALLSLLLVRLLHLEPPGRRQLGRLALIAGAVLAFITVAIPLQLSNEWVTLGWALEGAALAWLFTRIPHRGLLAASAALLGAAFVRLVLNPAVLEYHERSATPIFNWYLYTYLVAALALFGGAWFLRRTDDTVAETDLRVSTVLPPLGTILLFALVNIEVADFFAAGRTVTIHLSGRSQAEDLTYTLAWALFAIALLFAGVFFRSYAARLSAIGLLLVTILKAFLYDLAHLTGLSRVGSFVGLAISLALVALAIQKFVRKRSGEDRE